MMKSHSHQKPLEFDFDLIVIGTGSGGGVAAHKVAASGKRVAVVEMGKFGGECPNYGCVPTKALLQSAETYRTAKEAKQFGIRATGVSAQYPAIKAWKDKAVHRTGTSEGDVFFESEGIKVLRGHAHFINQWMITVHGKRYSAKNFLIATGTTSVVPPIPGLKETGFLTYREAIDLVKPPKSLFVIGGGAIGCEFAHFFATMGVKVHVADIAPRLLANEDESVGDALCELFTQRGINVLCGTKVMEVTKSSKGITVKYERDGKAGQVTVEQILLATGKAPNTDMGLENAGVKYGKSGIATNRYMQTNVKHIYAAGDITGPYRFTHTATYQSRIAAHNISMPGSKVAAQYHAVPRCVFVEPEIACVGLTEQELKDKKMPYQVGYAPVSIIGRANTSNSPEGFVKVLATKKGLLVGAAILSPRAGEMVHELTLAIHHRLRAKDVAGTIHAFPTWSETIRIACQKIKSK